MFDSVSILFSDVVTFTEICSRITPMEVVSMLNAMYSLFDTLTERNHVYKVKDIRILWWTLKISTVTYKIVMHPYLFLLFLVAAAVAIAIVLAASLPLQQGRDDRGRLHGRFRSPGQRERSRRPGLRHGSGHGRSDNGPQGSFHRYSIRHCRATIWGEFGFF